MDLSFLAESDLLVKSIIAGVFVIVVGIVIRASGHTPLNTSHDKNR